MRRFFCCLLIFSFLGTTLPGVRSYAGPVPAGSPQDNILSLTPPYAPLLVKGITMHPDNPFQFDFIVDTVKKLYSPPRRNVYFRKEKAETPDVIKEIKEIIETVANLTGKS